VTTITHLASGLVIGKIASEYAGLPYSTETIYLTSVVFSVLPDINYLWRKNIATHHDDFTHYPVFWLIVSFVVFSFNRFLGVLLLSNTFIHLFLDTFGWIIGIRWLTPFNKREFSFTRLEVGKRNLTRQDRIRYRFKNLSVFVPEILSFFALITYLIRSNS